MTEHEDDPILTVDDVAREGQAAEVERELAQAQETHRQRVAHAAQDADDARAAEAQAAELARQDDALRHPRYMVVAVDGSRLCTGGPWQAVFFFVSLRRFSLSMEVSFVAIARDLVVSGRAFELSLD